MRASALASAVLLGLMASDGTTPKTEEPVTPETAKPPETWSSVFNLDVTKVFQDVTWSESLSRYVAVGYVRGIGGVIMYSADGNSWTEADRTAEELSDVTWSESIGRFVAVGTEGFLVHSSDGISWSEAVSGTSYWLGGVAWGESAGRFVAVGRDGIVVHSSDGNSWHANQPFLDSGALRGVTWSESLSRFVAVGYDYERSFPVIAYSDDGATWSMAVSVPGSRGEELYSVVWSEPLGPSAK